LKSIGGATVTDRYVCVSGNIITAKGMGASLDFAIAVSAEFIVPRSRVIKGVASMSLLSMDTVKKKTR
jgi:transcriptional regulator GlxA family with amidase domain